MSISWGKPKVEFGATGVADAAPAIFTAMPTIEENSALLTTVDGAVLELFGEGHERVAAKTQKSSYKFTCTIFVKKGETAPMNPVDGVVSGEQCIRLTPEDITQEGFIMRKTMVQVSTEWSSAKGKVLKYSFTSLQPSTGNQLEPYTQSGT